MLYNENSGFLEIREAINVSDEIKRKVKLKINEGIAGKTARTLKPVYVKDIRNANEYKEFYTDRVKPNESLLSLPLAFSGVLFGVLNLHFSKDKGLSEEEIKVYEVISKQISIALSNARNYEAMLSDRMTGVFNHDYFVRRLKEEIEISRMFKLALSLLLVDIDYFKKINDTFGHQVGDFILIELAKLLKNSVRLTDIVARYGGEEFAVILAETKLNDAVIVAERLRKLVEATRFTMGKHNLNITISIGVASLDMKTKSPEQLIKRADMALYEAKKLGRNQVQTC